MVDILATKSMEKANIFGKTVIILWESGKIIRKKDLESTHGPMVNDMKDNTSMINRYAAA